MKMIKHMAVWSFTLAAGVWVTSYATASNFDPNHKQSTTPKVNTYQKPEDALDDVPVLSKIPRSILFGDGYKIKLGTTDLRVDHMASNSRSGGVKRNCMVGFSYTTPVAGFFTSRIDFPLLNSADLHMADWGTSSFGDYVAYFSKGVNTTPHPILQLVMTARF